MHRRHMSAMKILPLLSFVWIRISSTVFTACPINQLVYRLFDLTPDEIALIESSLQS